MNTLYDIRTTVKIGSLELANPIIAASGCFGFGREYSEYIDLNEIGAISTKGLTLTPRLGNKPPRIAETASGILNSVGLENPGVRGFIEKELPFMRKYSAKVIANLAGGSIDEYVGGAKLLANADIDAIELNLSCPNVKAGCASFGAYPETLREAVCAVRNVYKGCLIVKLTPNVTSITELALAAEAAGADGISLINTLLGMAIDAKTRRPILRNNTGGLSGPAVKPVALRMARDVYKAVKIPVIGMGGIMNGIDAAEFMIAGCTAVMVGSASFVNPTALVDIKNELINFAHSQGENNINNIVGTLIEY
jgi:dihydroorotate dehydrogenase (NAD+) catalytic subunit